MTFLPRRHTAWPTDRGWPVVLDFPCANDRKPPLAHSPPQLTPQPLRRVPIQSDRPNYWLAVFGAASGLMWAGLLASIIGFSWWMLAPIFLGAGMGALFSHS